ncbi:MAG TPA: histidine kinase [Solirubrobacteraceae bacterium]
MTRWLRLGSVSAAAGAVVAVMFTLLDGRRPFLNELAVSLVISFVVGGLGEVVVPIVSRRLPWSRPALAWTGLTATFLAVAATGCVLAAAIVVGIGLVPAAACGLVLATSLRISALVSLGVGTGCFVFESMRDQRDAAVADRSVLEAERERAEKLATEARLASLESRLHPHFLFNTLNAISALIPEDPARAERLVEQLAALLRFSLDAGERHTVSVGAEVAIVRAYLGIEEARLGDRLRCAIDVPDALAACDVPALALHTLVQNSVKHVAAARVEPTEIRVRVEARAGRLHLSVWDGGDKFDLDAIPAGHGLDMLRTRLDVLYGAAGRLAVQGAAGGKEVSISLPLRRPE